MKRGLKHQNKALYLVLWNISDMPFVLNTLRNIICSKSSRYLEVE